MADGNTEYIAAVASGLREQQAALRDLLASVESSLADMTGVLENGQKNGGQLIASIESSLADLAKGVEQSAKAIAGLKLQVNVPAQAAPAINVQVQPTPITVEAVMPAPVVHFLPSEERSRVATWEVTLPAGGGYPKRVMTIKRTE